MDVCGHQDAGEDHTTSYASIHSDLVFSHTHLLHDSVHSCEEASILAHYWVDVDKTIDSIHEHMLDNAITVTYEPTAFPRFCGLCIVL